MKTAGTDPGCRNQPGFALTRHGVPVRFLMVAALALGWVTAGCGADEPSPPPSTPAAAKQHEVVYAAAGEFYCGDGG